MNWLKRYMDNLDVEQSDNKHDKTLKMLSKKAIQRVFFVMSAGINSYDRI